MGSKSTGEGAAQVYAAAQAWVDRALRADDSLFTPNEQIWARKWLGEIRERFLDQPEHQGDDFLDKLEGQLRGSGSEVYQLMAEALYVNHLIDGFMKPSNKAEQIENVLGWSNQPVTIPEDLGLALESGLIHPGQGFYRLRPFEVGFIIEFVERWKQEPATEREGLLDDPWAFKKALSFLPKSALLQHFPGDGTYRMQREALLHLVFPDDFEAIVSTNHKSDISQAFADLVTESTEDVDQKLQQIRRSLEAKRGRDFNFYDDDIRAKWDPSLRKRWDDYVSKAQAFVDAGQLDSQENNYKVKIGRKLGEARDSLLKGADDWVGLLKSGLSGNLVHNVTLAKLRDWLDGSPGDVRVALRALWKQDPTPVSGRIRAFADLFPQSAIDSGGAGTRMNVISLFLMGLHVEKYPPFRIRLFNETYGLTGYGKPDADADEAALYEHALNFLDLFIEEALGRGLKLRHRLDAQSLVWMVLKEAPPVEIVDAPRDSQPDPLPPDKPDLAVLAEKLHLPADFLEKIDILLREKKQIIFQGPPGTGKTYVAQKLAECLAGSKGRVTLVQFHPSYAYEDFVQGFRPSLGGEGQPAFTLRDGPLVRAAGEAWESPDQDHFLLIDEINRGHLAKILGELYFLLEYRKSEIRLQYSDDPFSLPPNLYIIGTMNTADRSIALVDLALRRRFYFEYFQPDDEPIKGLLRRWLKKNAPTMDWVADVVEQANRKLADDRNVAIGPSYFMLKDSPLNEEAVERIWNHSVLPYIEEHLFGNFDELGEWQLAALRKETKAEAQGDSDTETEVSEAVDAPH